MNDAGRLVRSNMDHFVIKLLFQTRSKVLTPIEKAGLPASNGMDLENSTSEAMNASGVVSQATLIHQKPVVPPVNRLSPSVGHS